MKKIISIFTCLLLVCFMLPTKAWAAPMFFLNSQPLTIDYILVENAPPLLPLSGLSAAMGVDVSWDAVTGTVKVHKDRITVQFKPGEKTGLLNHEDFILPQMEIKKGRIMVSLDFWKSTMSDYYVTSWDPKLQVAGITVKYPANASFSWNGGVYDGQSANGVPNGNGKIVFPDGSIYQGSFHNGFPTLAGTWYSGNGSAESSVAVVNVHKGPNPPGKIVAFDGVSLCFCDPSTAGSGQIYKLNPASYSDKTRLAPEIAGCMDLESGWLYYINNSEDGKLYRVSVKNKSRERLTEFAPREFVVINNLAFAVVQNASGNNAIYQIKTDSRTCTEIFNSKNPPSDLQVEGNALYFSTSQQIIRCDLNGGHLTEIAAFNNPIENLLVQGNWFYYQQQGTLFRISSDNSTWQKILASEKDKENFTGFLVDDQLIYLSSQGTGSHAQYNGIYSCTTNGSGKHLLQPGNYQLQACINGRLFYMELDSGSNQVKLLKSLVVKDDRASDVREYHGTTDPDSQFGYPSTLYYNDLQRFITNADLAANDPQIKSSLEQAGIDTKKADLTITRRGTLLIIDPHYLGSIYTDGRQNETFLKTQGVLLNNFGGNVCGPLFKTSDNGLKMLLVWDRRDENGNPVFSPELMTDLGKRQVSDKLACPSERFLFLDYNNYWYATLNYQIKDVPHLLVNVAPGHYLVGYEQWDPTLQHPLNSSRRNLMMLYQAPLASDE